ncbi:MAG: hypothetical protein HYS81_00440 [Candidatus Aenigmatarchaeota archaeon]|nr:MAG: hypothetical protein HYS81_00440 [Candidatus Aenigmarchaeota archaeon]
MVRIVGYPVQIGEREAKAAIVYAPVSTRNSRAVCRRINGMPLEAAKKYLGSLLDESANINGRHHTFAAEQILVLLESAQKNAEFRGLGKTRIRTIIAEEARRMIRRKRKGGRQFKLTHLKVVLQEVEKPKEGAKKGPKAMETATEKKAGDAAADKKSEETVEKQTGEEKTEKTEHAKEKKHEKHEHAH